MNNQAPGPKGNVLLGSMLDFRRDPLGFLLNGVRTYGDIFRFRVGPYRVILISGPDHIHEVLVAQAKKIRKADFNRDLLARFLGNGILTSDGDFHRRQRRLVQPAFHHHRLANYADVMVNYTLDMLDSWKNGGTRYNIAEEMMTLTMRIVSKTLFDAEVGSDAQKVGMAVAALQEITVSEFKLGFAFPDWIPTGKNRRRLAATGVLDDTVRQIIRERRASGEDRGDLLSMLLQAQDEDDGSVMTDTQVRDEAATLFAAGHETTSNALMWTWYLLSQNPDAEAKLQEELDRVLGSRPPTLEDLADLKYTEMVIKEAMRLHPPAWILMTRTPLEPITVGGYPIHPGEWIFIAPYVMHRDPQYFEEPERFEPERFSEAREAELPRYAYFPFGGGKRVCIGNSFAMMEARLILATMAQRCRLALVPGQQIIPEPEITLSSRYGLQMTVSMREAVP